MFIRSILFLPAVMYLLLLITFCIIRAPLGFPCGLRGTQQLCMSLGVGGDTSWVAEGGAITPDTNNTAADFELVFVHGLLSSYMFGIVCSIVGEMPLWALPSFYLIEGDMPSPATRFRSLDTRKLT